MSESGNPSFVNINSQDFKDLEKLNTNLYFVDPIISNSEGANPTLQALPILFRGNRMISNVGFLVLQEGQSFSDLTSSIVGVEGQILFVCHSKVEDGSQEIVGAEIYIYLSLNGTGEWVRIVDGVAPDYIDELNQRLEDRLEDN